MIEASNSLSHPQRRLRRLYWAQSGLCYLCGEIMIAPSVAKYYQNDPRSPSIDHVVPKCKFKKGKGHQGNVLLAHRCCNTEKSNSLPEPKHIKLARMIYDFSVRALMDGKVDLESTDYEIIG